MSQLLIATHNPAKFEEFKELLKDYPVDLLSLKDLDITDKAPEEGETFEVNAVNKAKFYYQLSKLPTLADDSGLEIDVLNGWPGVTSRRIFTGSNKEATDEELINETLRRLQGKPLGQRTAHFTAVLALAVSADQVYIGHGQGLSGQIALAACRKRLKGYPFRSLFFVSKYNKMSAELSYDELKAAGSLQHRYQALQKLKPYLTGWNIAVL